MTAARKVLARGDSGFGFLVLSCATTPYLIGYRWSADGFGEQVLPSPALAGSNFGATLTRSPDGEYVLTSLGNSVSPFIQAIPVSFVGGFGTALANPSILPLVVVNAIAFAPDGSNVFWTTSASDPKGRLVAHQWDDGFGLRYANGTVDPGTVSSKMQVSPDGLAVLTEKTTSPFVLMLGWSELGWGTAYSNPGGTAPTSLTVAVFSRDGGGVIVGDGTTPYVHAWPFNSGSGFGTKHANPATLPAGAVNAVAFNEAGTVAAIGHATSPFMSFYEWDEVTGWGAKFDDPATLPTAAVYGIQFTPDDKNVICTMLSSPYVEAWEWDNTTGFGAKFSNPATLPPGQCRGITFI